MAQPILELGDLVPEHVPVRINRVEEEWVDSSDSTKKYVTKVITLQAYRYGSRCPVVVKAALAQIKQRFALKVAENNGVVTDDFFQEYARDSFLQLIPGMTFEEADVLASDDDVAGNGKCVQTLRYLGYWKDSPTEIEDEADPEVKREESLITHESSLISD